MPAWDSFECLNCDTFYNIKVKDDLNRIFYSNGLFDVQLIQLKNTKCYNNLLYLEVELFMKLVVKAWKQIEEVIFSDYISPVSQTMNLRGEIVNILLSFQECLLINRYENNFLEIQDQLYKSLNLIKKSVFPIHKLNERCLKKIIHAKYERKSPAYVFLHSYLDLQWLILSIVFLASKNEEDIRIQLTNIFKDLIKISYSSHNFFHSNSYTFGCLCIKKMWLKLQLFTENCGISFWDVLNPVLNYDEEFSLWLILNIASLQGINKDMEFVGANSDRIKPNFPIVESQLKSFLKKSIDNKEFLKLLKHVDNLLNYWWINHAKIDLYQILWDYFNKKLNSSFTNEKPFKCIQAFVNFIDQLVSEKFHSCTSSYDYFLHMLAKHLQNNPNHWPRIKGRIYSRLPLHKINEFNEFGLYHIIILFLSLHESVSFEEITSKLLQFLENVSPDRRNSALIWNTYLMLIIFHERKKLSLETVAQPLVQLAEYSSNNRSLYHLLKLYVEGMKYIFNINYGNYRGKIVLLSSWMYKYMLHCKQEELIVLLNFLCNMVRKIQECDEWQPWENVFQINVLPGLRQIALTPDVPVQVGELVALICKYSKDLSKEYVRQFTKETITPRITIQFISFYLNENSDTQILPKDEEISILQAWIRCSLITTNSNTNLSRKVLRLKTFSSCGISSNCDSLHSFIKSLSLNIVPHSSNASLKEVCEICFGHADTWIEKIIKMPTSEELLVHIYAMFGVLFYHCSVLLYNKAKSNCLLSRLTNTLLLPTDFLKGKVPHNFILNALQRTWHLFVQGIFQLDCGNDLYLERLMKDLIVRYLPHLPVNSSPIFKCIENEKLCVFIFEKICTGFLSPNCKSMETREHKSQEVFFKVPIFIA
ncbi:protein MMS22-like [Agrilus planipennis]|uniref:Protein MMS22-like n=1 Tax=Agrilus planipennis TaxID=224129 RepID=A0A7F5RL90_AGRPL|nr:protein MMS22-like [Agrilus planipennis]